MITNNQKELIVRLISGGMVYRKIGELFHISQTAVKDIKKDNKFFPIFLSSRKCILCGNPDELIDDTKFTICSTCQKTIIIPSVNGSLQK